MKTQEIIIIKNCLSKYGDDFWKDDNIELQLEDGVISSNVELIYDIISTVNKAGYDLKLIKLKSN
jgi:hypothetical protein